MKKCGALHVDEPEHGADKTRYKAEQEKKMNKTFKKLATRPLQLSEQHRLANAEAGRCTQVTQGACGLGASYTTASGPCGQITRGGCGLQEQWSR